jgi:exosortase D (VPLPA-CTERM-specific)
MPASDTLLRRLGPLAAFRSWGMFWLAVAVAGAAVFFREGLAELFHAWQSPEYSHGPLIPVLSTLLFLRQLKGVPVNPGPVADRGAGLILAAAALALALAGKLLGIGDIVAYALILWVGAVLLVSFGWRQGRAFWPPVLHLVYMLPLPGALYYGVSTWLQGVSSELGVWFLQLLQVPVYLEGNIIDLGVYKLHVAEACSGLRYLFPILSFSYIFAVLYRGPLWHKAVLLISAAPITVLMNSVRIAIAGVIVDRYGLEHVEGFSHFFEGWVIFISCVVLLFGLARVMVFFRRDRIGLIDALDLDTDGLGTQAMRLAHVQPSRALIALALGAAVLAGAWQAMPERAPTAVARDPFSLFPAKLGSWQAGPQRALDPSVERILAADDYHSVSLQSAAADAPVDLFLAWYKDQLTGGTHDPEVCLPGGGWEIAELHQIELAHPAGGTFTANRAVIQQGFDRMLVYYWFEQQGRRTASGYTAKLQLLLGKVTNGRNDSAIVRLITPLTPGEPIAAADARLKDAAQAVLEPLPRFVPDV